MIAPPTIVLASSSPYRRELLARLRVPFEVLAPDYDEAREKVRLALASPEQLVVALALGKARAVAAERPDALVLGSDQAAVIDAEILGKPGTEVAARTQLRRLAGREHRLLTAVCLLDASTGRHEAALDVHRLGMRELSDEAIATYVSRDQPLDCAGAYRIEAGGIALFDRVSGDDFTAVIGLPLTAVVTLLARFGVSALEPRRG